MQLTRFLTLLFLWIAVKSPSSQGQTISYPINLQWVDNFKIHDPVANKEVKVFYFQDALFNDPQTWLPSYQGRIKLTPGQKAAVRLQQTVFQEIPEAELASLETKDIADSVIVSATTATEQKQTYLIYTFVPLRKNPVSGKIERLMHFTPNVSSSTGSILKSMVKNSFAAQSIFRSGNWYKFFTSKSGVYKISYADLKSMDKNPENVRIYGNGGKQLSEVYSGPTPDDPEEIPVYVETGADGVFNDGDYILFYAEGPVTYFFDKSTKKYTQQKHPFGDKVSYFLTFQPGGKRIQNAQPVAENSTANVTSFDGLAYHEENLVNLLKSGQTWYGEDFKNQTSLNLSFNFPGLIPEEPVYLQAAVAARSGYDSYFSFYQGSALSGTVKISSVAMDNYLSTFARSALYEGSFSASSENITLKIGYNRNGDPNGNGWLDYISLTTRQDLKFTGDPLLFRDSRSVVPSGIAIFHIKNAPDGLMVWDVTKLHQVCTVQGTYKDGSYSFKERTDDLHEFVAFDGRSKFLSPEFPSGDFGKMENQNLHALPQPDMIIVSHPMFLQQAKELADLHLQKDQLKSVIVTPDQIFNEFSSGMPDPAAVRNFVKMFYERGSSRADRPEYLLLFGDGSYDNRLPYKPGSQNTNLVTTYESINSLYPTLTFVSDDYFGFLDDNEPIVINPGSTNSYTQALLDIGIGRLPVKNTDEANAIVSKIRKYYDKKNYGDWRNRICFIADDEDENIHMQQADELASYTRKTFPTMNIEKIYLDAYPQVSSSTGQSYPQVTKEIQNDLNRGLLILNYTGHGNERSLAHEQIVRQNEDIRQWTNEIYPLFITATCEFSRFDSYEEITAGEDVLLNPSGGGIALLTTNRLVYSAPNFVLNQQFYREAFTKSEDNPAFRLGDIVRKTKNAAGTDINKLNFTLLGDPALSLAVPQYSVVTDSINSKPLDSSDTLRSYSKVIIKGHIESTDGSRASDFNGTVLPTLFDKTKQITTLANDGGTPFLFNLQNNVLFKGKSSVKNGEFSISLMLPRDMDYAYGNGRISYYAWDSLHDATGYLDKIIVGGISLSAVSDQNGPDIRLFMNDTTFQDGGITDEFPVLLAKVRDENGINPGGNSIGHDIVAVVDEDMKQSFILNDFYESNLDTYKSGTITFKMPQITPGEHILTLKIWDIFNNSSQKSLKFKVLTENKPAIQNVLNYPNPFADYTDFYFEHNQPSEDMDVSVEIYNLTGKKVKEIKGSFFNSGFTCGPIRWYATDEDGTKIPAGIYIYRVRITSSKGTNFSNAKKFVFIKP